MVDLIHIVGYPKHSEVSATKERFGRGSRRLLQRNMQVILYALLTGEIVPRLIITG